MLKEILRLTEENNRMLHAMRRGAFLRSLFSFIMYAVLLIAPIWLYMKYIQPTVGQLLGAVQQMQGVEAQAQTGFGGLQDLIDAFTKAAQSSQN